jgi:hypothetical protein
MLPYFGSRRPITEWRTWPVDNLNHALPVVRAGATTRHLCLSRGGSDTFTIDCLAVGLLRCRSIIQGIEQLSDRHIKHGG